MNRRTIGSEYEKKAAQFLQQRGCVIVEMNYRTKRAEIDIIFRDGDTLVFGEIKYRKNLCYGMPLEAVDEKKARRIYQGARQYIYERQIEEMPMRFDCIGICGNEWTWEKDVFEWING